MKESVSTDAKKRLARIAGQVAGLQKMVDEERYCVDILTQVAALRAALDQLGVLMLSTHLENCVYGNDSEPHDECRHMTGITVTPDTDFTRRSQTPVATGERLFTKWGFREVLELGAASIIQPDPCVAGGILETRQIAAMGETYYASVALHNPYGPVNMAACLQVAATSPNFYIQEFFRPERINCPHIKEPFVIRDGHIDVPMKPGIGVELDEEYCRAHLCTEPQVDHGRWFHDDGSVADW